MSRNKKIARKYQESKDNEAKFDSSAKQFKGKRPKRGKDFSKDEHSYGRNDVSWYTPDPQLLNDAGRWPYSTPVGTPLSRGSLLHITDGEDYAVPGICAARTYLTFGNSQNGASALNVAANSVYTFIRHQNSGARNYDANDLMIYIGALDSIYSFVTWVTRLYGTVPLYATMNKYIPDALAKAQGVDLDSMRDNMANFRAAFNARILKIGTLLVPNEMPIFLRHSFIFGNYYSEGPSIKDQIYFMYPGNFYKFAKDSSGAGMLKNVAIADYRNAAGFIDVNSIYQILDDMITPIFNDEDFNIMSGDILKAYGSNILHISTIPDMIVAAPVNNIVFLEQFKNMNIWWSDFPTASGVLDVTQDANKEFLKVNLSNYCLFRFAGNSDPYMSDESLNPSLYAVGLDEWSRDKILTTEVSDVTPETNMLITRLTATPEIEVDSSRPSGLGVKDLYFGSEIIGYVFYVYYNDQWQYKSRSGATVCVYDATIPGRVAAVVEDMLIYSSFRFHPSHTFVGIDPNNFSVVFPAGIPNLGIDNFSTIDADHLRVLHDVAILGEYKVPRLAVIS